MPATDPEYGRWWGTGDGLELYARITTRIGEPIALSLSRRYGVSYEASDVANTAVIILRQDFVAAYLARSQDPWAYLASILKREMIREIGAHFRHELTEDLLSHNVARKPVQPATIMEAAALTAAALAEAAPGFPPVLLETAVAYFAHEGQKRLSHVYTDATTDPRLTDLGLDRTEILAVANAVLGSRPDNHLNSLIAAYLADPAFDPKSSIRHRRALHKFAARIAKAHQQEKRLLVG